MVVNCLLLPEQWWQANAAGRLLSSSQQAPPALCPEYLACLHLALSFVRLVHQQDFTQPVETADSRRQCRSPGEGWGGSAGDTQSASHTGISAEPLFRSPHARVHQPFLISVCQEWNGGWRCLRPGGELQTWALFHFPREFAFSVNHFYFLLNIHLIPHPPGNCGTYQQFCPALLSLSL